MSQAIDNRYDVLLFRKFVYSYQFPLITIRLFNRLYVVIVESNSFSKLH